MKEVENILFDFNGTIVNDVDLCLELLNNMLILRNHKPISKERYLNVFGFPVIEYYKRSGFIFPKDNFPELAEYFIKNYREKNKFCALYDDVIYTLEYFKKIGKKLVIVSASEKTLLLSQLKEYKIDQYFSDISGLDDINATSKIDSAKKLFETKNYDLNKTILIGDTLHDKEVAEALNIDCILISRGHQSKEVLQKSECLILDNLSQLKQILK